MVWLGVTQNGCFNVYFIGLSSNLRHLNEGHCPSWEIRLPPDQILSLIEVFGQMQVSWPGGTPKSSICLGDVPLCYKPSSYWGSPLYRTPQIATPMRNEAPVAISWGQPDTAIYTSPTVSTCCGRCNSTSPFISGYIYLDLQLILKFSLRDFWLTSSRKSSNSKKTFESRSETMWSRWEWPFFCFSRSFVDICARFVDICARICTQKTLGFLMFDCPAGKCPKNARIWHFRSDLQFRYQTRKSVSNRGGGINLSNIRRSRYIYIYMYMYIYIYMHQALPPPPSPPRHGIGPILRSSPSPPVVWWGCGTVPLPPCGVVGVWYGMLGMYGVYGRSGMACLESMDVW